MTALAEDPEDVRRRRGACGGGMMAIARAQAPTRLPKLPPGYRNATPWERLSPEREATLVNTGFLAGEEHAAYECTAVDDETGKRVSLLRFVELR